MRHNSKIYGTEAKTIESTQDYLQFQTNIEEIDVVFLSPPWGGTDYTQGEYSIFEKVTPDIRKILEVSFNLSKNVIFLLGRNTSLHEIVQLFVEYFDKYQM
jgi:trimethylguanosine synthase